MSIVEEILLLGKEKHKENKEIHHLYLGEVEFQRLKNRMYLDHGITVNKVPGNTLYNMKIHWAEEESHLNCC